MNLENLKKEIQKYQYFEDDNVIDLCIASVIATRLRLGNPLWIVVIGASSGGKSQLLRPISLTDKQFIHRVDDLTENTFLSGANLGEGKSASLLDRIGSHGMIVLSDLTVLFSKHKEAQSAILSQFRMLYDGEMNKSSGNSNKNLTWKGYLGVLAGSTPSIYKHFEDVADMGERFIYYRMKEFDRKKATELAMNRKEFGKDLDEALASSYEEYIKETVTSNLGAEIELSDEEKNNIIDVSIFAEKVRTPIETDFKTGDVNRVPVSAYPMRTALQLSTVAKALKIMKGEDFDMSVVNWCAYSLANEEKRACLRILAGLEYGDYINTSGIADIIGLSTTVTGKILQNLSAVGVLDRSAGSGLIWRIKNEKEWGMIRKFEKITENVDIEAREVTGDEQSEIELGQDEYFR